jgi:hypothetical protein
MKIFFSRNLLLLVVSFAVMLAVQSTAAAPMAIPNPVLIFVGQEHYQTGGKQFIRYSFDVFNKDEYPAEMFSAAPELPPCGKNTKASRTWVDIYDQSGKRLYGFCALAKPGDLGGIWFALDENELPPSWIYIELNDRKTNTKYKSNLAETTL